MTTRDLLISLYNTADALCKALSYTQKEQYEPDYELGYRDKFWLHDFAKRTLNEAEGWLEELK